MSSGRLHDMSSERLQDMSSRRLKDMSSRRLQDVFTLHGKPYFLSPDVLKRWSFQKNRTGIWSFLYYQERWYFFFPKIWSYTLDGKWKMIFLKKYTEIWYFLQTFLKDGLSKKGCAGTWSFLYYLERWYFFPENMIFFLWAGSERRSFPGNTWKHDASPSEEKQETWYIGLKFGFSLNLPSRVVFGVCLSADKGNYLSIRG